MGSHRQESTRNPGKRGRPPGEPRSESERRFRTVFEASPIGISIGDPKGRILDSNRALQEILGYTAKEIRGESIAELMHPDDVEQGRKEFRKMVAGETNEFRIEKRYLRKDGELVWGNTVATAVRDSKGAFRYAFAMVQDISEGKKVEDRLRRSLEEKEALLREIHHRVKNNLQMISSLLNLQSKFIKDERAIDIFKETQIRVKSMSLIHERLYESEDLKVINFGAYIRNLLAHLFDSYRVISVSENLETNVQDISLPLDKAIPCGLIVSELVSNSLKHAFSAEKRKEPEGGGKNKIRLEFYSPKAKEITMSVGDNGIGFPENLDFRKTQTFGLQLVCALVDQLEGKIKLNRRHGTRFDISFELPRDAP